MTEDMYEQIKKNSKQEMMVMIDIAIRNEAIADMLGFKQYLPSQRVKESHIEHYPKVPIRWFMIPGIGRYNSFELKFDKDWNWMVSVLIEMKKYENAFEVSISEFELRTLFNKIQYTSVIDLDLKTIWTLVSEFAMELRKQKDLENGK